MVFCNDDIEINKINEVEVTILILVDGFLQLKPSEHLLISWRWSHNPYFSRWFSATLQCIRRRKLKFCHNPYFSRWFSATYNMRHTKKAGYKVTILILVDGFLQQFLSVFIRTRCNCHNPYFSRWFSATEMLYLIKKLNIMSQSLF